MEETEEMEEMEEKEGKSFYYSLTTGQSRQWMFFTVGVRLCGLGLCGRADVDTDSNRSIPWRR